MGTLMLIMLVASDVVVRESEVISDAQMWSLIVGFGLPLLVAMIQQPKWSNPVRVTVTVLSSIVAGGGTAYFAGEFTGRSVLSCALVVCVAAIATYQNLWKPTRVAPAIEAATSPGATVKVVRGPGGTEDVVVDAPDN